MQELLMILVNFLFFLLYLEIHGILFPMNYFSAFIPYVTGQSGGALHSGFIVFVAAVVAVIIAVVAHRIIM